MLFEAAEDQDIADIGNSLYVTHSIVRSCILHPLNILGKSFLKRVRLSFKVAQQLLANTKINIRTQMKKATPLA
jgi:hypothetical protein